MSSPVRVLALAHDPAGPSARYRCTMLQPRLQAEGFAVTLAALPRSTGDRRRFFAALPPHDLVVLHRVLLGAGEIRWLRAAARALVFDVDDALPFRAPFDGGGRSSRRSARFKRICAAADAVVAGNDWIAEQAAPHAHRVAVVPTAVDPGRYAGSKPAGDGRTLTWIGQPPTLPYLEGLAPALGACAAAHPGLRLRVIGGEPGPALTSIAGLAVEAVGWSEASEAAELARADVGLAPLTDDPWSRGKCGLRLLQYLAAGLPAVASPVGTQRRVVEAGAAVGAADDAAWVAAIAGLLASPEEREKTAQSGRSLLHEGFTPEAVAPLVAAAWRPAAGTGDRP